jgi:ABC-type arginine transport system ATPase subunit
MATPARPEESATLRMLKGALGISGYARPSGRDMALLGYSEETKRAILRVIELSPVLEEAVLQIAGLAFRDGLDEGTGL